MIKFFVDSIVSMVKMFGPKPNIMKVLGTVMTYLPSLVSQAIDFTKSDAGQKFDEMLEALDAYTGSDDGAVRLFPHLPIEREEEFWEHITGAVRIYGNQQLKRPGYWIE